MPSAIQQVLVNLAINALDAVADVPQPRLTIRLLQRRRENVIEVEDNGSGIAPENLNRIFEPFFTTKPVGKGTGLGLSISYRLIERHGGTMHVHSTPGQGTTFTISFPADRATRPASTSPVEPIRV